MRAISKNKPSKTWRRPSLAGNGLPERMRTTAFAFLGLTAAAGLALVAIFAQLGFHVLSPAPLPDEPVDRSTVAEAVPLHQPAAQVPAVTQRREAPAVAAEELRGGGSNDAGTAPSGAPAPAAPAPGEGGVAPEAADGSAPKSTSTPGSTSSPPSEETSVPVSEPASSSAPNPAPIPARPASPAPVTSPAPGNSRSSAAAAHASDRGVEASSKSKATVEASPPVTSSSPPSSEDTSPGNGKGKALGHTK